MTSQIDDLWVPYADLLAMPPGPRIKYIRTTLGLSQDEFARAVGASSGRQAVIRWEKGSEPSDFAASIARLTPYPSDAFRQHGAEGLSMESFDLRLRAIEARLAEMPMRADVESGFDTLREAIDRLATSRTRGADQTRKGSAR